MGMPVSAAQEPKDRAGTPVLGNVRQHLTAGRGPGRKSTTGGGP